MNVSVLGSKSATTERHEEEQGSATALMPAAGPGAATPAAPSAVPSLQSCGRSSKCMR